MYIMPLNTMPFLKTDEEVTHLKIFLMLLREA